MSEAETTKIIIASAEGEADKILSGNSRLDHDPVGQLTAQELW